MKPAGRTGPRNAIYAQAGGATAVINATAAAVIEAARRQPRRIGRLYAAKDGLLGLLAEDLIDTSRESAQAIRLLASTPGSAFGTCRAGIGEYVRDRERWERIIAVLRAHDVGYVLYNGGNGSADTAHKLSQMGERFSYPLTVVGIPKTIDNDILGTDTCPGFGSAAKYLATSLREATLDLAAMASTSTRVFILEVMGRNAGWLTAACGLAAEPGRAPQPLLLFPEQAFDEARFLKGVEAAVTKQGYCAIAVSEGLRDGAGRLLSQAGGVDSHGNPQLGGVAPALARLVHDRLGFKCHWAVADYLQRSARHLASATDVAQARALGEAAVDFALSGANGCMPVIRRDSASPYRWSIGSVKLADIAVKERRLPRRFMSADGMHLSAAGRAYLAPLIVGEDLPPFQGGLPAYPTLKLLRVRRRLAC